MGTKSILVIIPTYNERNNISVLIPRLISLPLGLDILVVDDNSPDGTAEEVRALQRRYDNIHLIVRDRKRGLGSAYKEGFQYALNRGYDIIIQMDADLSHSPQYIPAMLDLMATHDMVIGSRYIAGGGVTQWSLRRKLLSKNANRGVKKLLRIPVHDLTSGFKCIRSSVLEKISFDTITSQGYSFQIELVYRAFQQHVAMKEFPIYFEGRGAEKSKMSIGIALEAFCKVFTLFLQSSFN